MEPAINSEAGLKAFKILHEIVQYSPPGVLNWGFTEQRDAYVQGKVSMVVNWADIGGQSEKPEMSSIVGDTRYDLPPGAMVDGQLNRPSLLAWGWCLMLNADSKNKEAAWQFIRYFSSIDVSTWVAGRFLGLEPWRYSHFTSPELLNAFPAAPEFYENMKKCMESGLTDLRIPGAQKYYDLIAVHLGDAMAKGGNINYQRVLDNIAKDWNEYTSQLGRETQLKLYRASMGYSD
jgi:multiple sugar transport system substrate-binding protein